MEVLIIGAGLAGICVAHALEERKIDFKIVDDFNNESTKVAGGMINPMSFRRMIKTWKGDELILVLEEFYRAVEQKVGGQFLFNKRIRRVFSTPYERELWRERLDDQSYSKYLHSIDENEVPLYINAPNGSGIVNSPGYIEAKLFLEYNQNYFFEKGKLEKKLFDFEQLDTDNLTYKKKTFSHFIFCEGYRAQFNPFFRCLPFKVAKGEILTITSRVLSHDEITNRKVFILPSEEGMFKLGSTYAWGTNDASPTEEAKDELIKNYLDLSSAAMEIVNHEAGIRPAISDRRPVIGEHPEKKGIYIFNGLGAKGFMIAPYFSRQFIGFLLGENNLEKEVDIQRFRKKYFPKNH